MLTSASNGPAQSRVSEAPVCSPQMTLLLVLLASFLVAGRGGVPARWPRGPTTGSCGRRGLPHRAVRPVGSAAKSLAGILPGSCGVRGVHGASSGANEWRRPPGCSRGKNSGSWRVAEGEDLGRPCSPPGSRVNTQQLCRVFFLVCKIPEVPVRFPPSLRVLRSSSCIVYRTPGLEVLSRCPHCALLHPPCPLLEEGLPGVPCALRAHAGVRHAVARVSGPGDLVKDKPRTSSSPGFSSFGPRCV